MGLCLPAGALRGGLLYKLKGVRRAIVAYWADALAGLRERNAKSVYARYHSYDAVSQLLQYKRDRDRVATVGLDRQNDVLLVPITGTGAGTAD